MSDNELDITPNSGFDIPVVLLLFKREDAALRIMERIAQVRPQKLYIMSDEGRDEEERRIVARCRAAVEAAVTWPCQVIKDYAAANRGVYENIGLGALRVFEREKCAIFLEDDNLPEVTFFAYCRQMLQKYWDEPKVLWVCGTNYFGEYHPADGQDYKFTQHMLPCGWASWSHKFPAYYDGELTLLDDPEKTKKLREKFERAKLYNMYREQWDSEKQRFLRGDRPASWDYQMCLSLRANDLLGIVPMKNQIKNIGVDAFSIHGGTTMDKIMTQRYCGMESYPLVFPLAGPPAVEKDPVFEKKLEKIIVPPVSLRIRIALVSCVKKILGIDKETSLRQLLQRK